MTAIHPLWSFGVGDTFPISGTCTDGSGDVIDLTGAQLVEWKLETAPPSAPDDAWSPPTPTIVLDLTLSNGITVTNATAGQISITITSAQSAALSPRRYRDQLRVITAAGNESTQWVGFIDVKRTF